MGCQHRGRSPNLPKPEDRRPSKFNKLWDIPLIAAAAVFAQKGFQGAQVAEIANAAEVSLNSVYGLFKGKEELYEAG